MLNNYCFDDAIIGGLFSVLSRIIFDDIILFVTIIKEQDLFAEAEFEKLILKFIW